MAVSGIRILSKKFTPLLCRSSVARTGMALTKTNHMSTPFVDSLNGAKRPFSSSSIIEDRHLFRQSWYPWPPVPKVARIQRQRDVVHVFGCLLARANQDALMQNLPPSQAEGERPIPS
ncbi:Os07g0158150 [Oryza sativa Japonica Group]|uniref:Os07g0158150 protein n=1 Tax=Oryza sativa subsp. japonica TaxID=39947 RepID=A0A0P0X2E0_ORYSJ|nr:Os07g0158150 [Oryza sativa Japonica Group]